METIEVGYSSVYGSGLYHQYILYTDAAGNTEYARGGTNGVIINTEHGDYVDGTPDYDLADHRETIASGEDLSSAWQDITNEMDQIESEAIHTIHFFKQQLCRSPEPRGRGLTPARRPLGRLPFARGNKSSRRTRRR